LRRPAQPLPTRADCLLRIDVERVLLVWVEDVHWGVHQVAGDPRNQLAVLFEGALALATSLNDTSPMVHARSAAQALIQEALSAS